MDLFKTFLYIPIYNLLVFLAGTFAADVGLAVVIVTVIIKIILLPVSWSAAHTQKKMQAIQPRLKELQELHKEDKEKQARETLALYKEHGVNPFGSILILILQLPILFALYEVVRAHLFAGVDASILYPFVTVPGQLSPLFLGILPITGPSIWLALIAGLAQLAFGFIAAPKPPAPSGKEPSLTEEMARMTALQVKYFLPVLIGVIAYAGGGAIALYFATSAIFSLLQQLAVNRFVKDPPHVSVAASI